MSCLEALKQWLGHRNPADLESKPQKYRLEVSAQTDKERKELDDRAKVLGVIDAGTISVDEKFFNTPS